MRDRLARKGLPVLILSLTGILTAAAIEFLPETLYFPAIEYTTPEHVRVAFLQLGELDRSGCMRQMQPVANAMRAICPKCELTEQCVRGLDGEHRRNLSREPLPGPSLRTRDGKVTITLSASDPRLGLDVCQAIERQSEAQPADRQLHCYPALASR